MTTNKFEEKKEQNNEGTRTIQVSEIDAHIADRLKGQPDEIVDIKLKQKDGVHYLTLPKELDRYSEKYAFKWIFKHKKSIDYHLDVRGWFIVKKEMFPELPRHLFTVNGAIERGDVILGVIPRSKAEKFRKEPGEKSRRILNSQFEKHEDDPRFYTPQSGSNEDKFVQRI